MAIIRILIDSAVEQLSSIACAENCGSDHTKCDATNTGTAPANAAPAAGASGTATPTGALSLSGQPLVLENDVLQLNINTQGGVVQYAMLKQFFNSKNHALNTVLFNSKAHDPAVISPNEMYAGRSGLTDVGTGSHHDIYRRYAICCAARGSNEAKLVLSAQNNGVTLKKPTRSNAVAI